jgi:hypothetical protein
VRYSEILGSVFYNIILCQDLCDWVDTHFTGSAHHYWRMRDADRSGRDGLFTFHHVRHKAHLLALMELIYKEETSQELVIRV